MSAPAFCAGDRVRFATVDSMTLNRLGVHSPAPMEPVPAVVLDAFTLSGYQAYTIDLGAMGRIVCVGAELTLTERAPVAQAVGSGEAVEASDPQHSACSAIARAVAA